MMPPRLFLYLGAIGVCQLALFWCESYHPLSGWGKEVTPVSLCALIIVLAVFALFEFVKLVRVNDNH